MLRGHTKRHLFMCLNGRCLINALIFLIQAFVHLQAQSLFINYITITLLWKKKKRNVLDLQKQSCGNISKNNISLVLSGMNKDFIGTSRKEGEFHPT